MAESGREGLHVIISGLVQGVGFRHATFRQATKIGLQGWVKNLPSGEVEALFEGERASIEAMLVWCGKGPFLSRVKNVESQRRSPTQSFESFEIAF